MKQARIKVGEDRDVGYYHCISRVVGGNFVFGDAERERFVALRSNKGTGQLIENAHTAVGDRQKVVLVPQVDANLTVPRDSRGALETALCRTVLRFNPITPQLYVLRLILRTQSRSGERATMRHD